MKGIIKLKIRDAENIVFDGEVDRISSFNEVGRFDIYPMHANFISIIRQELTLYRNGQKIKQIKIEQAILKVKKDVASIFLGIDTLMIDEEKVVEKAQKNL
jgi:F0F1-type ATP synthase epsilon subunit